jgi:preprotein translocase subunit SecD
MRLIGCIAAFLLVVACTTHGGQADQSPSEFGYLSLHWEAAGPSNDVRYCDLIGSGKKIGLDPGAVLEMRHFAAARTTYDKTTGIHSVDVVMTAAGRQRLKELSSRNIGRRLAIVVDDDIVALGTVWRTIDTDALNLPAMADAKTAEDVARRINAAIQSM